MAGNRSFKVYEDIINEEDKADVDIVAIDLFYEDMDWDRGEEFPLVWIELQEIKEDTTRDDRLWRDIDHILTDLSETNRKIIDIMRYYLKGSTFELADGFQKLTLLGNQVKHKIDRLDVSRELRDELIDHITKEELRAMDVIIDLHRSYIYRDDVDIPIEY